MIDPAEMRVVDKKGLFVGALVDSTATIINTIWSEPHLSTSCDEAIILPLTKFIQETLRRSRTSYSTLQVALYYLILIKPHAKSQSPPLDNRLRCGRRAFLAALILASKYLQDRNYSARAWSKISGLKPSEITAMEVAFLKAVNWSIHVTTDVFQRWSQILFDSCHDANSIWPFTIAALTPDCYIHKDVLTRSLVFTSTGLIRNNLTLKSDVFSAAAAAAIGNNNTLELSSSNDYQSCAPSSSSDTSSPPPLTPAGSSSSETSDVEDSNFTTSITTTTVVTVRHDDDDDVNFAEFLNDGGEIGKPQTELLRLNGRKRSATIQDANRMKRIRA